MINMIRRIAASKPDLYPVGSPALGVPPSQKRWFFLRGLDYLRHQSWNFRIIIARAATSNFLLGLTSPFESIYIVALGATSFQLGLINSVGNIASTLTAIPAGWLVNHIGVKRYFLLGTSILAFAMFVFMISPSWAWVAGAMLLANLAVRLNGTACGVTCTASLKNRDRGTGMGFCNTLSSMGGLIAPLVATPLVFFLGGVNVSGLRPLYGLRFLGTLILLGMLAWLLRDLPNGRTGASRQRNLVKDFGEIFANPAPLRRWIVISVLTWIPTLMAGPFILLYAHEVHGASVFTLGLMGSAITAASLMLGIPLGRLADRIGRKKVLYFLSPAIYLSFGLLVYVPSSLVLVISAGLWGLAQLSLVTSEALGNELVPLPQIGRWKGVLALFRGLVSIPAPMISGFLWDNLGPGFIFLIPIVLDLGLRLPLLSTMPETLDRPACACMA